MGRIGIRREEIDERLFPLSGMITGRKKNAVIIWLCNTNTHRLWEPHDLLHFPYITDPVGDLIVSRYEEMNLLVAHSRDILILREQPDRDFLHYLESLGLSLPNIIIPHSNNSKLTSITELVLANQDLVKLLKALKDYETELFLFPYAVTKWEEELARRCGARLAGPSANTCAFCNNKVTARQLVKELGLPLIKGGCCQTLAELREAHQWLTGSSCRFSRIVVKEPYGASGKGLYLIERKEEFDRLVQVLEKRLTGHKRCWLLIEGWYDQKYSFNYQIMISCFGQIRFLTMNEQRLNKQEYIGSRFAVTDILTAKEIDYYQQVAYQVGRKLWQKGYWGIAGIDSIVTEEGKVFPVVEINARFNMSTYLIGLRKLIGEGKSGVSKYYNVSLPHPITFSELQQKLLGEDLLYSPEVKEGVVPFNFGALNGGLNYPGSVNQHRGRLFTLIVGNDAERVRYLEKKVDERVMLLKGVSSDDRQ